MTEYYAQADDDLLRSWIDESRAWQVETLGDGLRARHMAGGGGEKLTESIRQFVKDGNLRRNFGRKELASMR